VGSAAIHLIPDHTGLVHAGHRTVGLAVVTAATAYRRWALNETSMRLGEPLPPSRLPQVIAIATALVAMGAVVFFVIDAV
jgi:putative membrane protein